MNFFPVKALICDRASGSDFDSSGRASGLYPLSSAIVLSDIYGTTCSAPPDGSIEYIRIAYKQGIIDAFSILRETL